MSDYQISVRHDVFTRWYNKKFHTNHSEDSGVPTDEWNWVLNHLNMTHENMPGSGTWGATYVLRAHDGGAMARQLGLDQAR